MARALDLESQHWAQDVAPQKLNGHCHSELAIDIIQVAAPPSPQPPPHGQPTLSIPVCTPLSPPPFPAGPHPHPSAGPGGPLLSLPLSLQIISQGQVKAESITPDLGKQIQHMLLAELAVFLSRWVCAQAHTEGPAASSLRPAGGPGYTSALQAPRESVLLHWAQRPPLYWA